MNNLRIDLALKTKQIFLDRSTFKDSYDDKKLMRLLLNDEKKKRQTNKQLKINQTKTNQTKTNKNNQNKNQGHIYMVKVSTTVFKVLVFETATLFLIFSDYGHICSWNYTLQLHTTACAVTGGWCSSSDVFFQLPCWPCVHNNANIPRQKVHHVYSCEFFFNLLVTKFPTVTVLPYRTFETTSFAEHLMPTANDWVTYHLNERWISTQDSHNSRLKDYFANNKRA